MTGEMCSWYFASSYYRHACFAGTQWRQRPFRMVLRQSWP